MFFATLRQDRSSALWMNLTPSETTPDHACTVPQRACRTTSAPVSTSRMSAVASHASISKAIRISSLLTQPVAIMWYVQMFEFFRFEQYVRNQNSEFRSLPYDIHGGRTAILENSNGDIFLTDHPIYSVLGPGVGFSGLADRIALFRVGPNSLSVWEKIMREE